MGRRATTRARRDWAAAYVLLAPAAALLCTWFVYPIFDTVLLGFQRVDLFNFSERTYVGLTNFDQLWSDPAFHHSLFITGIFVLFVVPAQTVLALLLASVLQSVGTGKTFFRTAFFLPYMTSTVAVTTVFMKLFVDGGPLSTVAASLFGVSNTTWYADPSLALPFLVIVYVYMYIGLYVVVFLGGIENVPVDLHEAAKVDGAGVAQRFRFVTVPSVRPYVFFVIVAGFIQAVQIFDQAYVIASNNGSILGSPAGATATLVIFIYQQAFRLNNLGYGSAAAVVLLLIVFAGTVLTRKLLPEKS